MAPERRHDHDQIRRLAESGMGPSAIAREVGCSKGLASLVVSGDVARHYPDMSTARLHSTMRWHLDKAREIDQELKRRNGSSD